eukprot:1195900-Prorocentrum_minimum.AAC.8
MLSAAHLMALPKIYDWGQFGTLVDVGGSLGITMECIKKRFPKVTCINFDLPEVVEAAPAIEGVLHVGGDMFDHTTIPSGADCIFMKHMLHDWSDEDSTRVLKSLHKVGRYHAVVTSCRPT